MIKIKNRPSFASQEEIIEIQEKALKKQIDYCVKNSKYYKKRFKGVDVSAVKLSNLSDLPLTSKSDMQRNNESFIAVPDEKVTDIVFTSGSTATPLKVVFSENDLKRLALNEEKSFLTCGLSCSDTVLLTCTMDRCFIAGMAYFLGLRALNASVLRTGNSPLDAQARIIEITKPTAILGVPSFLKKLAEYIQGNYSSELFKSVKRLICIGEPLRNRLMEPLKITKYLESIWDAKAYSTYASTEVATTFCECGDQKGGHLLPDLGILEIVNENGTPLPAGEIGEIVITPLGVEATPLIRYRTGDMGFMLTEPCRCGRNTLRLGPILGRKNLMLKVKGTTVFPQVILSFLQENNYISDYYISVHALDNLSDRVKVHVSLKDENDKIMNEIENGLKSILRVKPELILENDETMKTVIYGSSRKAKRIFDDR